MCSHSRITDFMTHLWAGISKADAETMVAAEAAAEANVNAKLLPVPSTTIFECQSTLTGHSSQVTSVAWNKDGSKLATGSFDQSVVIWSVGSAGTFECKRLTGHTRHTSVAWNKDGSKLATVDRQVIIWAVDSAGTFEFQSTLSRSGHSDW